MLHMIDIDMNIDCKGREGLDQGLDLGLDQGVETGVEIKDETEVAIEEVEAGPHIEDRDVEF